MTTRKIPGLLILGLLLSSFVLAQGGARVMPSGVVNSASLIGNRATDEAALRQLNEQLLTAHDHADVTTLDRIEADDFTIAGDFGTVNKKAQLDHLRAPDHKTESVERKISPQEIRLYGDVALITETDHSHTADGTFDFETSSMWVRAGDSWRVVHMHFSELAKK